MGANADHHLIYSRIGTELSSKPEQVLRDEKSEVLPIKKLLVENLEFAFPGQVPVFQNINLTAELGRITVVFGATGSGKSLMVSVLNRLLPLQKGEIIINGYNWLKISDYEWREISASVMQPVHIFNGTLLENIGWSEKYFETKKIISFCKKMEFDSFFKHFPNDYAATSNNLSAGQKQLVGFAAALYRNPQLLLLDDPFVFMDDEMFSFCMELLHKLKNEMVSIIFTGSNRIKSKEDNFLVCKMINYN